VHRQSRFREAMVTTRISTVLAAVVASGFVIISDPLA
jgi:hypothetical protein